MLSLLHSSEQSSSQRRKLSSVGPTVFYLYHLLVRQNNRWETARDTLEYRRYTGTTDINSSCSYRLNRDTRRVAV